MLPQREGSRECRTLGASAAACAKCRAHAFVTTVTPESPGIPRTMVLTAYSALSLVTGLSCHHRLADTSATLDASVGASGPHGFAVRDPSAFVSSAIRVHRIPPRVRDDREPPLQRDGTAGI